MVLFSPWASLFFPTLFFALCCPYDFSTGKHAATGPFSNQALLIGLLVFLPKNFPKLSIANPYLSLTMLTADYAPMRFRDLFPFMVPLTNPPGKPLKVTWFLWHLQSPLVRFA